MSIRIHPLIDKIACAYLIESKTGMLLVDTGLPYHAHRILEKLHALGRKDLQIIFITHAHPDHYGSAASLRNHTGARIAIHRADGNAIANGEAHLGTARGRGKVMKCLLPLFKPFLKTAATPADLLMEDGESLPLPGIRATVLHTPGHTPGSSCLIVEDTLAFAGDLLSTTGGPHPQRFFAEDWSRIPTSLQRLLTVKPTLVYPGHGETALEGHLLGNVLAESVGLSADKMDKVPNSY